MIVVPVRRNTSEFIKRALKECIMTEDQTLTFTADFGDGMEMDIKVCGCEDEPAWTEAVLFKDGEEVNYSEVGDTFLGEWMLEYRGRKYEVLVKEK